MAGLGDEEAYRDLERIAVAHRGFELSETQLRMFVKILIELAVEHAPRAADACECDVLKRDWHTTIECGLSRFMEFANVQR